ncbi:hypothetical protein EDI_334240 [Entamoeba dispar SAW760]|uniref:Uncharacterized protein n=1 Tax=Entamoeba dispar (strain ATCC PRA-260 / SAW760) TaxID=370354 RepID=B0E9G5_ENTDS|nr:uncharacterized protein EDI_334240 [Entamoeba dispar SAW760]EDR28831.1 hypothetical protein EDI_334240 [Entamoeba dispar SAW760]|eukprot:EDR28831.1 hypothetical protein EDI_334240 [Entamoeba dispar SAW760]
MKELYFAFFISVVMSEYFIVSPLNKGNESVGIHPVYELGRCYNVLQGISTVYTRVEDSIRIRTYQADGCTGESDALVFELTDNLAKQMFCTGSTDCLLEFGEIPNNIGHYSSIKRGKECSEENEEVSIYITDGCFYCQTDDGRYCKYGAHNGYMSLGTYPNNKCDESERSEEQQIYKCGCSTGVYGYCSNNTNDSNSVPSESISLLAIAIIASLGFLI